MSISFFDDLGGLFHISVRPPKSSKNEMFIFGLCSFSDDRPSDLSNESRSKCENMKKLDLKTRWHFGSGKYYSM